MLNNICITVASIRSVEIIHAAEKISPSSTITLLGGDRSQASFEEHLRL